MIHQNEIKGFQWYVSDPWKTLFLLGRNYSTDRLKPDKGGSSDQLRKPDPIRLNAQIIIIIFRENRYQWLPIAANRFTRYDSFRNDFHC